MTAQEDVKSALRDVVGPAARAAGFKGSVPSWRRSNALGDWAVVNVQSSSGSSSEEVRCVINLALAPAPWLEWLASRGSVPKTVTEYLGLYRDRLHPTGTPERVDGWWVVRDERDAAEAATDMVERLDAAGWPLLTRLLDRGALLERIRAGSLGSASTAYNRVFRARAEALLLSDEGPSSELDRALEVATAEVGESQRADQEAFNRWVLERARSRSV